MSENDQTKPEDSMREIRIVRLNTDKTQRLIGSETLYQVYFELSESPPIEWRIVFEQEWKSMNVGAPLSLQDASVSRAFLVLHCPLNEVAARLPVLKKAVVSTNISYKKYVVARAAEETTRENFWKDERRTVDDVAKSLHFD